jgi:hypothetical protein
MPERDPGEAEAKGGRVFRDARRRSWRATVSSSGGQGALQFTCLGEPREAQRVMAVGRTFSLVGVTDDSLREWLESAPRLERLTE